LKRVSPKLQARNLLYSFSLDVVWKTIKKDLPKLKKQIEKILEGK